MRVERLGSSRWKDFLHEVERAGENIVSERTLKRFEEGKHKPDMQLVRRQIEKVIRVVRQAERAAWAT